MNQNHDHTAEQLHATHQEDREYNGGKWLPRDQREGGDDAARRDQGGQRQQRGITTRRYAWILRGSGWKSITL